MFRLFFRFFPRTDGSFVVFHILSVISACRCFRIFHCLFPYFAFRVVLQHFLFFQIGILISGSYYQRNIFVLLFAFFSRHTVVLHPCRLFIFFLAPIHKTEIDDRYFVSQLSVDLGNKFIILGWNHGRFFAEHIKYIVLFSEHTFADTFLYGLFPWCFWHKTVSCSSQCHIHTYESGKRSPRSGTSQHNGICRSAQYISGTFFQRTGMIGCLAA